MNKLESLSKKQEGFLKEMNQLWDELASLKTNEEKKPIEKEISISEEPFIEQNPIVKPGYSTPKAEQKLYRDLDNKIIGGVCSGIAQYFNINKTLVRLIWIILSLFYFLGIFAYIILLIAVPGVRRAGNIKTNPRQYSETSSIDLPKSAHRYTKSNIDLEKFIGGNLISIIGVIITVFGVGIGVKYSIDNELISPLTRIILAYITGIGLLGFGMKLKKKYESYSAVLVSGAIAILYFITYAAYSFYDLIPQTMAFALMLFFTAFSVLAAINYNKQVIALIGLVGAYAIPFLLSEETGQVLVLYSYMTIINIGILVISFKKYWKLLYYTSFGFTWMIYYFWFISDYNLIEHFGLALSFLFIFFAVFYLTFLAYKLLQNEKFEFPDIFLLLLNSFIFYGFGYIILEGHETGKEFLGLFTLANAIVHFTVSAIFYKQKLADKNLFYLVAGLVLVFITIAIPVQLEGSWVTLLWIAEAAILFWIGRSKKVAVYEYLSYPLMILAFFSLAQDWTTFYKYQELRITPLLNVQFLSSMLFIGTFGFIYILDRNKNYLSAITTKKEVLKVISYSIPAVILFTIYYSFFLEIEAYWEQLFVDSLIKVPMQGAEYDGYEESFMNHDLLKFKTVWLINYSLFFFSVLAIVNIRKVKNRDFAFVNLTLIGLSIMIFLFQGLYTLSELRESYLLPAMADYYQIGQFNIGIRYVSFAFLSLAMFTCYKYIRLGFMKQDLKIALDLLLYTIILWVASSELINLLDISGSTQSYKLGLSILWGSYSLLLIGLGIWKQKKYLRIGAFSLFGVALLKLFLYDLAHLETISKTIVLVTLGILLLIISFLYNKYKHIISNEVKK